MRYCDKGLKNRPTTPIITIHPFFQKKFAPKNPFLILAFSIMGLANVFRWMLARVGQKKASVVVRLSVGPADDNVIGLTLKVVTICKIIWLREVVHN